MSYILDALKKSERERALVRGVGFADAARRVVQRADWLPWLISGVALFVLAVVVLVLFLRDRLAPPPSAAAAPVAKAPISHEPRKLETPVATPAGRQALVVADTTAPNVSTQVPEALPLAREAPVEPEPEPPVPAVEPPAKFLVDMPPEFQQIVPPMAVNIHVYAQDETQRILYINNQQYYRGDEVTGGVTVEEIVPEGVVLRFRGQRFKLPRPS